MDRVSDKSYTPVTGAKLKHSLEPASCFRKLRSTKIEAPPISEQSTHTNTSVFKQATSLLQEPNLQNKSFSSKSKAEYSLNKSDNKNSLEKVESTRIRSLNIPNPHINKVNRDLEANLRLATRIAGEVSQAVPHSINALEAGRVYYKGPPTKTPNGLIEQKIFVPHGPPSEAYHMQRDLVEKASNTWDGYFQLTEEACQTSRVGNCKELTAIACKKLKEGGAKYVDYVAVTDNATINSVVPHAFAVVGRTANKDDLSIPAQEYFGGQISRVSDLGLPDQWGDSAVICDPWARNAYPAKDFDQFWDNLKNYCNSPDTLTCVLLHRLPET